VMRNHPLTPGETEAMQVATEFAAKQERLGNRGMAQRCRDARWRFFDDEPRLNQASQDSWLDEHISWTALRRRYR
jgi:hypothetical protein